jgi:hypothetical protein
MARIKGPLQAHALTAKIQAAEHGQLLAPSGRAGIGWAGRLSGVKRTCRSAACRRQRRRHPTHGSPFLNRIQLFESQ